ncbi:hypothetical protein N9Y17_03985 [Gammaproteobacteria bacterium]|nr:hypothetical protein [Gammaproteobacteria bacterium]
MDLSNAQQDLASITSTLNGLDNHTNGSVDGLNENVLSLKGIEQTLGQISQSDSTFGMSV